MTVARKGTAAISLMYKVWPSRLFRWQFEQVAPDNIIAALWPLEAIEATGHTAGNRHLEQLC